MAERITVESILTGVGEVDQDEFMQTRADITAYVPNPFITVYHPLYQTSQRVPAEYVHEWIDMPLKKYMEQLMKK
jgi:hypothetical protein